METTEMVLTKGGGGGAGNRNTNNNSSNNGNKGGGGGGGGGDGFIDRSKVRILLCDSDSKRLEEAFKLVCKCSYQVTCAKSPRQVIGALNAEGPDIDIILSEVDLPMSKGLKLLKYVTRDQCLRRIPVIMMSAQDEVSVVVKCLRLGAADYLVKPLRTNELLNLWTHMWRRRRMLGLAEKNIVNYDFDQVLSDPSDANTNSTTLFSDDTDDKSRKNANLETCLSTRQEYDNVATVAIPEVTLPADSSVYRPDLPVLNHLQRGPKKSGLKIGESSGSAFFTYVKSGFFKSNSQIVIRDDESAAEQLRIEKKFSTWSGQVVHSNTQEPIVEESQENHFRGVDFHSANTIPGSSMDRSSSPQQPSDFSQQINARPEESSQVHMHPPNGAHHDFSNFSGHYPYFVSGIPNQTIMSTTASMYQKGLHDLQSNPSSAFLHQKNHIPHFPHVPGVAPFPYYPVNVCLQPGQMPTTHPWPPPYVGPSTDGKLSKVDQREAALLKFKRKRKERCFDKKIRYVNRKRLAEKRPRVKGQFVRKMNGLNVNLNGQPTSTDFDDEEDED